MAMTVNTNISGLTAQNALVRSKLEMDEAMERLATGMRINSGGDDASGLSISTRMESQIRALEASVKNAADGISLVQTAEGALNEVTHMLQRMRELAVQASSGIPNAQDRLALDAEVQSLKEEIDRIATNTIFNDNILFDGSFKTVVQVGPRVHEYVDVTIPNLTTNALGSLTNTATTRAVTDAIFDGTVAQPTLTQLTFDDDDTYRFALTIEVPPEPGSSTPQVYTYNVSGVVENGSARDIAKDINQQLRSIPAYVGEFGTGTDGTAVTKTAADSIRVEVVGNAVTLENLTGGKIEVNGGQFDPDAVAISNTGVNAISDSSSRIRYTTVNGAGSSSNVVLGDDPYATRNLTNIGGNASVTSSTATTTPASLKLQFVDVGAATHAPTATISNGDVISLTLTDELGGKVLLYTDSVNGINGSSSLVSALNGALVSAGADDLYEVTADPDSITSNAFVITRADGLDFNVKLDGISGSGSTSIDSSFAGTNAIAGFGTLGLRVTPTDLAVSGASITTADSDITLRFADSVPGSFGSSPILAASDGFTVRLTDVSDGEVHTIRVAELRNGSASTVATALNTAFLNAGIADQYEVTAEAGDLATSGLTFTHKLGDQFKIEFTDIGSIAGSNFVIHEKLDDLTISDTLDTALYSTNGSVFGETVAAVAARPAIMYLDPLGADTYKFKFASDAVGTTVTETLTARYDGTNASLETFASRVNTTINRLQAPVGSGINYDFDVTVEGGRIKITENNGNGFSIRDFVSDGAGKIVASVPAGQGANSVNAVMLDDTEFVNRGVTNPIEDALGNVVGRMDPTEVLMTFDANDVYEFRVSDGTATAVVNPFAAQASADVVTNAMSAINVALENAGMDGVMKAVDNGDGKVKLLHTLGRRIIIEGFNSDNTGVVKVEGTSGTTGVATFLDDDTGATGKVVSSLDIRTSSGAQDALDIISRALEDINAQRAAFGAIENRLEYTINNLSNISTNTAAAKSRIEDADYASESAKLAKTQVLQQAGTAILAQANMTSQQVLQLLNG